METNGAHDEISRRGILWFFSTVLMLIGLVAGYGLGLRHFFEYLVPLGRKTRTRRMFVGTLNTIPVGSSFTVRDLAGQEIAVARTGGDAKNEPQSTFRALSSTCPHLGCKVHWDAGRGQFVCPCHQGIFDEDGTAVSGPPAKEKQKLARYPIEVDPDTGWVFVRISEVPGYDQ